MEELHVIVEFHWANSLDGVFDVEMVTGFEEGGGVVDEDTVEDGVDANAVPDHLRSDFIHQVEIDRVLHVIRSELFSKASLIKFIVFKNLDHDIKIASVFVSIEANSELLSWLALFFGDVLSFLLQILIFKDVIEYFFQ